jgi:hypothetical protein
MGDDVTYSYSQMLGPLGCGHEAESLHTAMVFGPMRTAAMVFGPMRTAATGEQSRLSHPV